MGRRGKGVNVGRFDVFGVGAVVAVWEDVAVAEKPALDAINLPSSPGVFIF